MSEYNAIEMLQCLPQDRREKVKHWMRECGVEEADLTGPLLSLLASACDLEDEGMKRVIAAMIEQEASAA